MSLACVDLLISCYFPGVASLLGAHHVSRMIQLRITYIDFGGSDVTVNVCECMQCGTYYICATMHVLVVGYRLF